MSHFDNGGAGASFAA